MDRTQRLLEDKRREVAALRAVKDELVLAFESYMYGHACDPSCPTVEESRSAIEKARNA